MDHWIKWLGKSTLLQIITGTLAPDKGYVKRPDNVHTA